MDRDARGKESLFTGNMRKAEKKSRSTAVLIVFVLWKHLYKGDQ